MNLFGVLFLVLILVGIIVNFLFFFIPFFKNLRHEFNEKKLRGKTGEIHYLLKEGDILFYSGKIKEALKKYKKIYLFNKNHLLARIKIFFCYYFYGDFIKAEEQIKRVHINGIEENKYLKFYAGFVLEYLCKIYLDENKRKESTVLLKILKEKKFRTNYKRCFEWKIYKERRFFEASNLISGIYLFKNLFVNNFFSIEDNYRKGMIMKEVDIDKAYKIFKKNIENKMEDNYFYLESKKMVEVLGDMIDEENRKYYDKFNSK